jgi:hypothetical protein
MSIKAAGMASSEIWSGLVFRFERGLCPRNPIWGEVRKGGVAPSEKTHGWYGDAFAL